MNMTKEDRQAKAYIKQLLKRQGYKTYAMLFDKFNFHMISGDAVAYLDHKEGSINVNRDLDADQCSVIVRHEILHSFLDHHMRMIKHLAKKRGLDPDKLDDLSIKEITEEIYGDPSRIDNIAKDYEISNRGYTAADKRAVRNIQINGKILCGLVTEDKNPEWVDLPFEDMYDMLKKEAVEKVYDGTIVDEQTAIIGQGGKVDIYGVGPMPDFSSIMKMMGN